MKSLRMEKTIFSVNLMSMLMSLIFTGIFAYSFNNLPLLILSIIVVLAIRSTLAEMILSRRLGIPITKDIMQELGLIGIFVTSGWFLPMRVSFVVYLVVLIVYVNSKKTDLLTTFQLLKMK